MEILRPAFILSTLFAVACSVENPRPTSAETPPTPKVVLCPIVYQHFPLTEEEEYLQGTYVRCGVNISGVDILTGSELHLENEPEPDRSEFIVYENPSGSGNLDKVLKEIKKECVVTNTTTWSENPRVLGVNVADPSCAQRLGMVFDH